MLTNTLFDLSGKVALVTGGSRGLGLEIATALGDAGAAVAITARRREWLTQAEEELRGRSIDVLSLTCDVSDPQGVAHAVATVVQRWGAIHILVNNAGISWAAPAEDMPLEKWRSVMETNVTGTFLMCQAVGAQMIRAKHGSIVNIGSVNGLIGTAPELLDAVGYSASKGAVAALTRDLAVKWARHGIRVNALAPGFFPTRLTAGVFSKSQQLIVDATPLRRAGRPGELNGAVLFLASGASSYVTGQVLAIDGGMTAW